MSTLGGYIIGNMIGQGMGHSGGRNEGYKDGRSEAREEMRTNERAAIAAIIGKDPHFREGVSEALDALKKIGAVQAASQQNFQTRNSLTGSLCALFKSADSIESAKLMTAQRAKAVVGVCYDQLLQAVTPETDAQYKQLATLLLENRGNREIPLGGALTYANKLTPESMKKLGRKDFMSMVGKVMQGMGNADRFHTNGLPHERIFTWNVFGAESTMPHAMKTIFMQTVSQACVAVGKHIDAHANPNARTFLDIGRKVALNIAQT